MKKQSLRSRGRARQRRYRCGISSTTRSRPSSTSRREDDGAGPADATRHLGAGRYATWALGILAVILAIVVATNWTSSGRTKTSEVWTKLYSETKPEALAETAKRYPGTAASEWALLHAANEYYASAMGDLPNNRDVAVSNVKKSTRALRADRQGSPEGFFPGPRRAPRQGPLPGSTQRACRGDRAIRARGQELARLAGSRASQTARRSTQKAGSRRVLQRAVRVFSTQGDAAAARQRKARLPRQHELTVPASAADEQSSASTSVPGRRLK